MSFIDFHIYHAPHVESVFSDLSCARWNEKFLNKVCPLKREELLSLLKIEDDNIIPLYQYLKEHDYEDYLNESWLYQDFEVENIEDIQDGIYHNIHIKGNSQGLPFKLISKICKENNTVFMCRFDNKILIYIDKDNINFINLDIVSLSHNALNHYFFDSLSNIEKEEIALSILIMPNLWKENKLLIENYKLNNNSLEVIYERIIKKSSLFIEDKDTLTSLVNAYFLYRTLDKKIPMTIEKNKLLKI